MIRPKILVSLTIFTLAANMACFGEQSEEDPNIKKISETFGNFIGRNLKTPSVTFDMESLINGIREGVEGKPAPMTEQEYEEAMAKLMAQADTATAEKNLKEANVFIEDNAQKENVVEVEPGKLQYLILEKGNGETVKAEHSPLIHYSGKLIDGNVFGSSEQMGNPITISLGQTIPGFQKGIIGMREGEKRRLFIHPDLGYGTSGQLPPNALLIFDIEVLKANNGDVTDEIESDTNEGEIESESNTDSESFSEDENDSDGFDWPEW